MSNLDDVTQEHMANIVFCEHRPFCYKDFLSFNIDNQEYGMTHGTFRNKISKLTKEGKVELSYYSSCAFYTLIGHKFGKPMTSNHMVVHNNPVYRMIRDLPLDKQSIHDIHLKFKVTGIWQLFSSYSEFQTVERSQDIVIPSWIKNNAIVRVTIHKTDIVSVVIGCSLLPIPLDSSGVIRLFTLLAYTEAKIQSDLDTCLLTTQQQKFELIPDYKSWVISMWHFGRDGLPEYTGEKFSTAVEDLEHIITRVYSKEFGGRMKIRIERQEYPNKPVEELVKVRLFSEI